MLSHVPVLLAEALAFLGPQAGGRFIDGTLGGGGHAREILDRTAPDGRLLALDRDESAIERGRLNLDAFGSRLELVKSNFRDIAAVAQQHSFLGADGVLADIGVSSMMLDDPSR